MVRVVVRRKVIVVPFVREGPKTIKFMVVKDRKSKEWTFITGGCKARETDVQAAMRELKEETRNVLGLHIDAFCDRANSFQFRTAYRELKEFQEDKLRNERVLTQYTVFALDATDLGDVAAMRNAFRNTKNMRGAYNENTDLNFETLESFANKAHVWKFIRDHVLVNAQFLSHFHGLKGGCLIDVQYSR